MINVRISIHIKVKVAATKLVKIVLLGMNFHVENALNGDDDGVLWSRIEIDDDDQAVEPPVLDEALSELNNCRAAGRMKYRSNFLKQLHQSIQNIAQNIWD